MKRIIILITLFLITGCSVVDGTLDVINFTADIITPNETKTKDNIKVICDSDSVGIQWEGKTCLKLSDNTYKWMENIK